MSKDTIYLLFRDACGCKVYRTPVGFSLYLCKEHKKVKS